MQTTDRDQLARFREAARKLEADESDDALDRAFGKIDPKHKPDEQKVEKPKGE